jgi:hypothetical protein
LAGDREQVVSRPKGRDLDLIRVVINTDDGLMAARMVEAVNRETANALFAHIAQGHRRAGWVLGVHSMIFSPRPFC